MDCMTAKVATSTPMVISHCTVGTRPCWRGRQNSSTPTVSSRYSPLRPVSRTEPLMPENSRNSCRATSTTATSTRAPMKARHRRSKARCCCSRPSLPADSKAEYHDGWKWEFGSWAMVSAARVR